MCHGNTVQVDKIRGKLGICVKHQNLFSPRYSRERAKKLRKLWNVGTNMDRNVAGVDTSRSPGIFSTFSINIYDFARWLREWTLYVQIT